MVILETEGSRPRERTLPRPLTAQNPSEVGTAGPPYAEMAQTAWHKSPARSSLAAHPRNGLLTLSKLKIPMHHRLLVLAALLGSTSAFAVPVTLTHQGRILDSVGVGLTGSHDVDIAIYDDASGPSALWSESAALEFDNGFFSLQLGADSNNPIDAEIFNDDSLFIGIAVDSGPELSDRLPVSSVPFAILSRTAVNVSGGTVDASSLTVAGTELVDETGTWTGPLPTGSLADPGNCTDGQILTWSGIASAWECADLAVTNARTDEEIRTTVASAAIDLAAGSSVNGNAIATGDHFDPSAGAIDLLDGSTVGGAAISTGDHFDPSSDATIPTAQTWTSFLRVTSKGYSSTTGSAKVWLDGTEVQSTGRSYGLTVIDRDDGSVVSTKTYDVYGNATNAQALADDLAALDDTVIVVINTNDEPSSNRTANGLDAQILRCGGSSRFLTDIPLRGAYALVGICGSGAGTGIEVAAGDRNSDTEVFVDTTITLVDGGFQASSPGRAPRILRQGDTNGGCPGARGSNVQQMPVTFPLTRPSMVQVKAHNIRYANARADLYLHDGNTVLNQTLTYTSSAQWEAAHLSWSGWMAAGSHTVYARSPRANVWGCGEGLGALEVIIFE